MDDFLGTSIQYSEAQIKLLEEEHEFQVTQTVKRLIDSGFLESDYDESSDELTDVDIDETENQKQNQNKKQISNSLIPNTKNIIKESINDIIMEIAIIPKNKKYEKYLELNINENKLNEFEQAIKFKYYFQDLIFILIMISIMFCVSIFNS
eukprot:29850_1